MVCFGKIMYTGSFKQIISGLAVVMSSFPKWVIKVDVLAMKSIYMILKTITETHNEPMEKTMFARSPNPILKVIVNKKERQILRAPLSIE